jgi:WhiB family transcriptional regulator, redox-sensing transcriptional regulator
MVSPPWFALAEAILWRLPKLDGARCLGRYELFDGGGRNAETTHTAISICHACPALPQCDRCVASLPIDRRPPGITGAKYRKHTRGEGP